MDALPGRVDAIVVPTNRPGHYLKNAIECAARLDVPLVVLSSGRSSAAEAEKLARVSDVGMLAFDVSEVSGPLTPALATTALLRGTLFRHRTDIGLKRNIGLLVSRLAGWEVVAFLDDDILMPDPRDISAAAGLVCDGYAAVGLHIGGFPDNSVVCHAHRETGGDQGTFIGGGALVVSLEASSSFFPAIYNEDWFFLLNDRSLRRSAVIGNVLQRPYDPFVTARAQSEEFGDCLAEGVFALLDDDGNFDRALDVSYWRHFLGDRMSLIDSILDRIRSRGRRDDEALRMEIALRAARKHCEAIPPSLCVRYLKALALDRQTWVAHVDSVRRHVTDLRGALRWLGLSGHGMHVTS
ncbi:hypothetical protein [Saccharothrix carnea]|uniref:hypothetical protein n=1 Tax=Saccharothrix carnea TaxID=1280637 RepID=UPI0011B22C4A|nr:hypothetical protein [Saccharothrix carnea]